MADTRPPTDGLQATLLLGVVLSVASGVLVVLDKPLIGIVVGAVGGLVTFIAAVGFGVYFGVRAAERAR